MNCSKRNGEYPDIWKDKITTPILKTYSTTYMNDVRNISGVLDCDKILETLLSELIMSDIEENLEKKTQYGNRNRKSLNHNI